MSAATSPLTLPEVRRGRGGRRFDAEIQRFAQQIQGISRTVGFKVSARGWGYILEQAGVVTKAQFDIVEKTINVCREKGYLPVDFVAEEEGRRFSGVEKPDTRNPDDFVNAYLDDIPQIWDYEPDYWEGEEYYIQMVVEKIDIKTLFEPICQRYHIPIATSKGWSSILMRAEFARRFKRAEADGHVVVLLYFGDHDPDGIRISDTLKKNLVDISQVVWENGEEGYNPTDLIIERFGLNVDFIEAHHLTWIDNLITSSGKDLGDPSHHNHRFQYVQDYIAQFGRRKCEANALVVRPEQGRELCEATIQRYLGDDAEERFQEKHDNINDEIEELWAPYRNAFLEARNRIDNGDEEP